MTSQVAPFGSTAAFGHGATTVKRRRRPAADVQHMLGVFQMAVAVLLLAIGLLCTTAIGSASATDTAAQHGPVPGLGL